MKHTQIIGIQITDRIKEAGKTQLLLSKNADIINSRIGFHELSSEVCSRKGIIILHLVGDPSRWSTFHAEIRNIEGIVVQQMDFTL
ncbi:MAG: hypothetical protein WCP69_06700 [Bacteroidota bacterium]|jgi:hypothetical protein